MHIVHSPKTEVTKVTKRKLHAMDIYGLIGHPLGHSFSKVFFTDKFENEDIEAQYINFDIQTIEGVLDVIVSNPELKGFNVTIPYKQKIIPYLDEISKEAREIGAVNVVKVIRNGNNVKLFGFNSDVIGFHDSIQPLLRPHHKKALILGTGGAAKAIDYALTKMLNLETIMVSRYSRPGTVTYSDIDADAVKEYPVIINCTPIGMFPAIDQCPILPYEHMNSDNLLYDLIYNPDTTLFMKKGKENGAVVKNGLEMLLLQAFVSWDMWNNK